MIITKRIVVLSLILLVFINAMGYMQAKAMTEFVSVSARTKSPESLSVLGKLKVLLTGVKIPRPENSSSPTDFNLQFESHTYLGAKGETLEAWYIPSEESDVVILLFHGYASSKDSMLPLAKELHEIGVGIFMVVFFGSGGSSGTGTTIGHLESIDVTRSYSYARGVWPSSKLVLYGQSMGGASILRSIALEQIEPEGLIVEATYDTMLNTVQNRFGVMGIPSFPLANILVFWGGVRAGFNAFNHNPSDYSRQVIIPTLVLHGEHDPRVTTIQAMNLFENIAGWKRFSSFPDGGHGASFKADLQQWRQAVVELIQQAREKKV